MGDGDELECFIINQKFKYMNTKNIFASEEEKQFMRIHDLTFDFAKRIVALY